MCSFSSKKLEAKKFKFIEYGTGDDLLGIAIGGDGSFLRMVRQKKFNSKLYYVCINTGHLGFLQDVKIDEIDQFIDDLINENYKVLGFKKQMLFVRIKNQNFILLKNYVGDGIMLATSVGSTAHNLSYNGSIVYSSFSSLQITPMAPINSS